MLNFFTSQLTGVTHEDLISFLQAIGGESERVEIKQEANRNRIANTACAMANTFGGLIIVGFKDPDKNNGKIISLDEEIDASTRAVDALISSIQAKSYPAVRCEGFGITSDSKSAVIVRVYKSLVGPHEYIGGSEFPNLVVRHQKKNAFMPLSHLIGMQQRSSCELSVSPLGPESEYPLFVTDPFASQGNDTFFGATITPYEFPSKRRVLRRVDEAAINKIVHLRCPLLNRLVGETLVDGLLYRAEQLKEDPERTAQELHISTDGRIRLKIGQGVYTHSLYQAVLFLGNIYVLGTLVYHYLGIAPRANVCISYKCAATNPPLPAQYKDNTNLNFAEDNLEDFILESVIIASRAAKNSLDDNDVKGTIEKIAKQEFFGMNPSDLREIWV